MSLALAPTLDRDFHPGVERKYRVSVVQDGGDRFGYRLQAKMVETKVPKGLKPELRMDLRLTDYRATVGGQNVAARLIGGGEMTVEATGLPAGLNVAGPQGPVWLPLLSLYLPSLDGDGGFDVPRVAVGALALAGKGTWKRPRLDLDAALSLGDRELGKLTLATTLDKAGWPTKAEGTLVSADGTYRFKIEKA